MKLFEYLKLISPNGLMKMDTSFEWETIERLYLHWLKTGDNQFEQFMEIYIFLRQGIDFEKRTTRFRKEFISLFETVLKNEYVFTIEDMVSKEDSEAVKSIYERLTTPLKTKGGKRICIVSLMKTVREAVFKRDGYKCKFCGSEKDLTVDHIIPVDKGGKDEFSNFQTLCKKCNSSKSSKRLLNN